MVYRVNSYVHNFIKCQRSHSQIPIGNRRKAKTSEHITCNGIYRVNAFVQDYGIRSNRHIQQCNVTYDPDMLNIPRLIFISEITFIYWDIHVFVVPDRFFSSDVCLGRIRQGNACVAMGFTAVWL